MPITAKERRLQCYPPLPYTGAVKAYAQLNEMTESKVVEIAVRAFVDSLPADVKMRLKNPKNSY